MYVAAANIVAKFVQVTCQLICLMFYLLLMGPFHFMNVEFNRNLFTCYVCQKNSFVDLKSTFSLFPRWSHNFSNGNFLKLKGVALPHPPLS